MENTKMLEIKLEHASQELNKICLENEWHKEEQEDHVEAVIRHMEYAIEFAFDNDRLYQAFGSDGVKWIYTDSLLIKKVLKLVAQRCQLMEKLKHIKNDSNDHSKV